jgi:hypothetical protein
MRTMIKYLVAIYLGTVLISAYSYMADMVTNPSFSLRHVDNLGNYLVYFISYRSWLLGLLLPFFALIFYNTRGMGHIVYKVFFIIIASLCLTIIFNRKDLCFVGVPTTIRLFAIYFLTGISLAWIHLRYWHTTK